MAKKRTDDNRINAILDILSSGGKLSKDALSYLRRYYNENDDFRLYYDENFGGIARDQGGSNIRISSGRVQDAKDAFNEYGFSPLQNAKRAGEGTNELILRSGKRTNQSGKWQDAKIFRNGKSQVDGGRLRTKAETISVIKRGLNGGSLNDEDQRIFDRWKTIQRETAENEARAEERRREEKAVDAKKRKDRAEKFKYLGIYDDGTLNDLQIQELIDQRKNRIDRSNKFAAWKLQQDYENKIKAEKAKAENDAFNARYGVDAGETLSDIEKKALMDGKKKWGYSPEEQKKLDDLERQLQEIYLGGNASEEDRAALESQKYAFENGLKKRLVENGDPLTAEQTFNGTYTMEDGTILGVDQNGKLYTVWEPKPDAEEKRNQALQDRRDRWIDSRADKYLKEKVGGFDPDTKDNPKYGYDEALDLARKDAVTRFGVGDAESGSLADLGFENGREEIDAPSQEIKTGICPVCGAPLDENGYCAECGYQEGIAEDGDGQDEGFEEPPVRTHMKSSYL